MGQGPAGTMAKQTPWIIAGVLVLVTIAAIAYTVILSTWVGFAVWGRLLATYPAGTAAPLALLIPVFGGVSGYLVLGETLTALRLAGSLLIFLGLAIILLPWQRLRMARTISVK